MSAGCPERPRRMWRRLDAGEQLACAVIDQTRDDDGQRVAYSVLVAAPDVVDAAFARARPWRE